MLWGEIVLAVFSGLIVALIVYVVRYFIHLGNRGKLESGRETVAVQQLPEAPRQPGWFLEAEKHLRNEKYSKAMTKYRSGLQKGLSRPDRALVLGKIAICYRLLGDFRRSLEYWRKCLILAREVGDDTLLAHSARELGDVLHRTGKLREAKETLNRARAIFENRGDRHSVIDTDAAIGRVLLNEGKHKHAEKLFKRSLRYHWLRGLDLGAADARENLGVLYERVGRYSKSLRYLRRSLRTYLKHRKQGSELQVLNTIGVVMEKKGDPRQAMKTYDELLDRARKYSHSIFQGMALQNLASAYLKREEIEDARIHAEAARKAFDRVDYAWGKTKSLLLLAAVELAHGNTQKAEEMVNEALELAEECGFPREEMEDMKGILEKYRKREKTRTIEKET